MSAIVLAVPEPSGPLPRTRAAAWARFRSDKAAMGGLIVLVLFVLMALGQN